MMIEKEFVKDLDKLGVELAHYEDMKDVLKVFEKALNEFHINTRLELFYLDNTVKLGLTEMRDYTVKNVILICDVVYKPVTKEITLEQLEYMLLGETVNGLKLSKETLEFYNDNKKDIPIELNICDLIDLGQGETIKGVCLTHGAQGLI